jgi:hypothetical protein
MLFTDFQLMFSTSISFLLICREHPLLILRGILCTLLSIFDAKFCVRKNVYPPRLSWLFFVATSVPDPDSHVF